MSTITAAVTTTARNPVPVTKPTARAHARSPHSARVLRVFVVTAVSWSLLISYAILTVSP